MTGLFERRASGSTILELLDHLEAEGVKSPRGRARWGHSALRTLLRTRVYRGEFHFGPFVNLHSHSALVDEATWRCAQARNHPRATPRPARQGLLCGVLRCAGCSRLLLSSVRDGGTSGEQRIYRCPTTSDPRRACPAPVVITDSRADPYIERVFWENVDRARNRPAQQRLRQLRKRLATRERELEAYRDNPGLPTVLGPERFAQGLAIRTRRVDRAALEAARAERDRPASLPAASELREGWTSMHLAERHTAIREVVVCAFVYPGIKRPVDERLFICLQGRAPLNLPDRNRYGPDDAKPFDPSTCQAPARSRKPVRDWTDQELRAELERFLAGRDRWPSFADFQLAGRAELYCQIDQHAGHRRWANLMKLPYLPGRTEGGGWTDDKLRDELAKYLAGRTTWPNWKDFTRDGKQQLRTAVNWHGGPEQWAEQMGVTFAPTQRPIERWTYPRIKAELAEFVGNRDDWPTLEEFRAAGRETLYVAISDAKARPRLAAELGLHLPEGKLCSPLRWTDAAIKETFDEFLEGRTTWPTYTEFRQAGLSGLLRVLDRKGRRNEWARRYGLEPPRRRPRSGSRLPTATGTPV